MFRLASRRLRVEDDVDDELRHHIRECADYLIEQGYDTTEAMSEARRRFGDLRNHRSTCVTIGRRRRRRQHVMDLLRSVMQDFRFALRSMRRYPVFAVAVILTLALGIGANAAIYSVIDATMLRPPPYPNAPLLASVNAGIEGGFFTPQIRTPAVRSIQRVLGVDAVGHAPRMGARTDLAVPELLGMHVFDPGIFAALGITTVLGRRFIQSDVVTQAEPVVILSHDYWRSGFGADPEVVGKMVRIDDAPFRIIGVLPSGLKFPNYSRAQVWLPIDEDGVVPGTGNAEEYLNLLALTDESESFSVVEERAGSAVAGLIEDGEVTNILGVRLRPVTDDRINSDTRRALWVLMGACGLMWLIAVVNGTNLFLVRNSVRLTELKVRLSLGAGRLRIVRQILTEALVLALLSGVISVLVTSLTMNTLVSILPSEIATFAPNTIGMSSRVIWFVFAASALTGLFFGLVPAISAVRDSASGGFSQSTSRVTGSRRGLALRNALVILQVAVSMTMLIGATLLTRSFLKLSNVDPGFEPADVLSMVVNLPETRYTSGVARAAFRTGVLAELQTISGSNGVTEGTGLPSHSGFGFGGDSVGSDDGQWHWLADGTWVSRPRVDHNYFDILRIELVAGRAFRQSEQGRDDVLIIDEQLATKLYGSPQAAVGRGVRWGPNGVWRTVVGVAEHSLLLSPVGSPQALGIDEEQTTYQYYRPALMEGGTYMVFAIRTADRSQAVPTAMREAVAKVDPLLPVNSVAWLQDEYAETISKPRFNSLLMSLLAILATALTIVGVYGVLSFAVSTRIRELGIRMALGAPQVSVRRLVVGSGVKVTMVGVALGIVAAIPLSNTIRTLLYDTPTKDVGAYVIVSFLVLLASAAAAYLPSRRATAVDPASVLRVE